MNQMTETKPAQTLGVGDVVALTVGIVLGVGIFRTPSLVAGSAGAEGTVILAWLIGGFVSLIGALCYSELASTYPNAGGDYHFLYRAFGPDLAFLFAWARLAVIQTGSIALLAFVFGDYASELLSLGAYSSPVYAGLAVIGLTMLNVAGVQPGKQAQRGLTAAVVLGLILVAAVGFYFPGEAGATSNVWSSLADINIESGFGMALVFVLLTYGGWNEAAYTSAELRNVQRNMVRSLMISIGVVTLLYVLVNLAFIRGLGFEQLTQADAVAADLLRNSLGETGATIVSILVVVAALSSVNATIFTGARTNFALGRDFSVFTFLGYWNHEGQTPRMALLVQGSVALLLVGLGTATRQGFETMVDYTAPVFWLFLLLTGIALIVLRMRNPEVDRPFEVPFYPWTPLVFVAAATYMLWSSINYTGVGALVGVAVLAVGVPLLFLDKKSSLIQR